MSNNQENNENTSKKTKIKAKQFENLFEELKLEKSGIIHKIFAPVIKIFKPVFSKLAFLKKKKIWIPLLVFHILLFSGIGIFSYYQSIKNYRADYILSSLQNSLINNDPVLFNELIDFSDFSTHFINDFIKLIQGYKYVYTQIGEIPSTKTIEDNISLLLLDIFKGNEYKNDFINKTRFIPQNISQLLKEANFKISKDDKTKTYTITTTIFDEYWQSIPIRLELQKTDEGLKIIRLANLDEILQTYNYLLSKRHNQEQNFNTLKDRKERYNIVRYLPNSKCTAKLTKNREKDMLFISYSADPNFLSENLVSYAVTITVSNDEGLNILEQTFKNNTIVTPDSGVQTAWQIPLTAEQLEQLSAANAVLCEATPSMINAENGDYFDVRKK